MRFSLSAARWQATNDPLLISGVDFLQQQSFLIKSYPLTRTKTDTEKIFLEIFKQVMVKLKVVNILIKLKFVSRLYCCNWGVLVYMLEFCVKSGLYYSLETKKV